MPGTKLMPGQEPLTNGVPGDEAEEVGRAEIIYGKLRKLNAIQKLRAGLYKRSDLMIFGSQKNTLWQHCGNGPEWSRS